MIPKTLFAAILLTCLSGSLSGQSISVNFRISENDANSVDADESATQFETVSGQFWNNVTVRNASNNGAVNIDFDGTLLIDDSGSSAATLNSTIPVNGGYATFTNTSSPNQTSTGEAGLMQSLLNFGGPTSGETLTVNTLGSAFTSEGYAVYLFFDFNATRTYGFTVSDGTTSATCWTADTATDADADNDGVIEWVQATGTTSATATPNANYAVITGLSGSSFTISGLGSSRAALNGFQIVAGGSTPPPVATGKTISLNLYNLAGDPAAHQIPPGETAGYIPVAGEHWNQVGFNNGNLGAAAASTTRSLVDENGAAAATFTSTLGSAYVSNSGATGEAAGDRNLMASYLGYAAGMDTGNLRISGLPESITTNGYRVIVYFDLDDAGRSFTYTLTPEGSAAKVMSGDDAGTFSGTFLPATGTGIHANMAIFEGLASAAFTLDLTSSLGRAAVNGIQISSNDVPLPPKIHLLATDRSYVTPGTDVTLSWQADEATSLTLDPGGIDLLPHSSNGSGTLTVTVGQTTTYTLTAVNPSGTTTATVRVGAGPPRPNILVFLVDDMGWQDTSVPFHHDAQGNPVRAPLNDRYRTPHMEVLAQQSMMFTNAYACSLCSAARVSIMTGMNPARHRVTGWTWPTSPRKTDTEGNPDLDPPDWRIAGMNASDITLPSLLQQTGYRTIHAGKAHFAPGSTGFGDPRALGFDVNIAGYGGGGPGSYWGEQNYSAAWRGGSRVWDVPGLSQYHGTDTFLTEALTLEMNRAIEAAVQDGAPFFAYMAHYAVHAPFEADPRFTANYTDFGGDWLAFATLIEGMDKSLGDILAKLDQLGVAEDTLVIFTSDNGTPIAGNAAFQTIRGYKNTRYEGGMRVPFLAGWAKHNPANPFQQALPIAPGSREDSIIACWDLLPTVAGVAGASFSHPVDGHDLRPYFTSTPGEHRPQEYLLHFPNGGNSHFFTNLREGDWKLILNYASQSYELYNLRADIGETTNLAATEPARVMRMARTLARRLDEMDAQYPINVSDGSSRTPLMPDLPSLDLDGDGIPDNTEDPNRNGLVDPGETDPDNHDSDGDGTPDGAEVALGLDPLDPSSFFQATITPGGSGPLRLTWPSAPGISFTIRRSGDLLDWSETVATGIPAAPAPATSTHHDIPIGTDDRVFYRVELE